VVKATVAVAAREAVERTVVASGAVEKQNYAATASAEVALAVEAARVAAVRAAAGNMVVADMAGVLEGDTYLI